jgi:hypothetical protein
VSRTSEKVGAGTDRECESSSGQRSSSPGLP